MFRHTSMKRAASVLAAAILLAHLSPHTARAAGPGPSGGRPGRPAYVAGQVIVKYRQLAGPESYQAQTLQSRHRLTRLASLERIGAALLQIGGDAAVTEVVAELRASGLVEYAQPNYLYYPADTPDPESETGLPWGLEAIGAPEAWALLGDTELKEVIVAVVDTGVDVNHPDLVDRLWTDPACTDHADDADHTTDGCHGQYVYHEGSGSELTARYSGTIFNPGETDGDVHGTHVAGTVAAARNTTAGMAGVAPNVKIMVLKFLGANASTTFDAVNAIAWAKEHGAQIANHSWGPQKLEGEGAYPQDEALANAIRESAMLHVAAAGNYGQDNDSQQPLPASLAAENLIAVAATDPDGQLANFSNYGASTVDIAAPGVDIRSTVPGSGYGSMAGTSMAAPHVTGIAAVLMGQKNLTPAEIIALIKDKGTAGAYGADRTATGKIASLYHAVTTEVTEVTAVPDPVAAAAPATLAVTFTTSAYGGLAAGDTIRLHFSEGFGLDGAGEAVRVNDVVAEAGVVGQTLTVTVPAEAATGPAAAVTVTAPVTNPPAGEHTVAVSTSADPVGVPVTVTIVEPATAPPQVAVTAPAPGEMFNAATAPGGQVALRAAASHAAGIAAVTFSAAETELGTATELGDGEAYELVRAFADGAHTVHATATTPDSGPAANSAPVTFTVDTVPPAVAFSELGDGSIAVAVTDATSGVDWATLQVSGGEPGGPSGDAVAVTVTGFAPGEHTVTVTIADRAGNKATATHTFTVPAPEPPPSSGGGTGGGGGGGGAPAGPAPEPEPEPEPALQTPPQTIPPTGETITDDTTGLAVTFPDGAVSAPVAVTVRALPAESRPPAAPGHTPVADLVIDITATAADGGAITAFARPLTVTFPLPAGAPAAARIFYWDPGHQRWIAIPTRRDAATGVLIGVTDHLTVFAVLDAPAFPVLADVTDHWAEADILRLLSLDIVSGVGGNRFNPEGEVTRAEFARMLVGSLGLTPAARTPAFADAADIPAWAAGFIATAVEAGLVQGLDGNRYGPADPVTREQMATMIARALGEDAAPGAPVAFSDAAAISSWAQSAVQTTVARGIVSGLGDGTFAPQAHATRAQAARMLSRLLALRTTS